MALRTVHLVMYQRIDADANLVGEAISTGMYFDNRDEAEKAANELRRDQAKSGQRDYIFFVEQRNIEFRG